MYATTNLLPDVDTAVQTRLSGTIPVIEFGYGDPSGSVTLHAPNGTRQEQAEWLANLAAQIDALSVQVRDLPEKVSA